jgi:hypothetical protein
MIAMAGGRSEGSDRMVADSNAGGPAGKGAMVMEWD